MSKNGGKASDEAQDEQATDSVFDFLYHDSRRIGSFLAQFSESGLLTGIKEGEAAAKGSKRGWRFEVGGQVPVLGGGNLGVERSPGESGAETVERTYDPFWANARFFLDVLDERNMIQRDIKGARIGQFVLVTGSLIIADLKMLQSVWPLPTVQKVMMANAVATIEPQDDVTNGGNRQQRLAARAKQRNQPSQGIPDELKLVMEILPYLPHSGQFHLVGEDFSVWAPASEGSLVGLMSDLVLKHGAKIAGEWAILGILDALPYDDDQNLTGMEMVRVGMTSDNVAKAALQLAPPIRLALGRPLLSYGMTPLMVFREVS